MLTQNRPLRSRSRLYDSDSAYGWISILLHWGTAAVVILLWLIGQSILHQPADAVDLRRALHVSIAASAWLIILFRIIWRLRSRHPHVRGLSTSVHRIATSAHYLMLFFLLLMLLSGPLLVWSQGQPIRIFDWYAINGPIRESESLANAALFIHSNSAMLLFWLVMLHIGGALKHLMFHTDDTFARMIWPDHRDNTQAGE